MDLGDEGRTLYTRVTRPSHHGIRIALVALISLVLGACGSGSVGGDARSDGGDTASPPTRSAAADTSVGRTEEPGLDDRTPAPAQGHGEEPKEDPSSASTEIVEGDGPLSRAPNVEAVSWQEASEWWPHPLLEATWLPGDDAQEELFVFSWAGGREGDPRETGSSVTVLYQYPPATADTHDLEGIIDGGGIAVGVRFVTAEAPPSSFPPRFAEPVVVRGGAGQHVEFREPEAQDDNRLVIWTDDVEGDTVEWRVTLHPDIYSKREALEFIDRLMERASGGRP